MEKTMDKEDLYILAQRSTVDLRTPGTMVTLV